MKRILLILLAGCGSDASDAPPSAVAGSFETLPALTAEGGHFRDPEGRVVFLRGVNYSHRTKTAPHASWQKPDHFDQIREWGFNVVRYLVLWSAVEPEPGVFDAAYLDQVEQAIEWAEARGIYVVVDMHQDLYSGLFGGDGAPVWATTGAPGPTLSPWFLNYFTPGVIASFDKLWTDDLLQAHFVAAWKAVIERTHAHPAVVGYDLFNEPFPGSQWPWTFGSGRLTDFYAKLIAALPGGKLFLVEPAAVTANNGIPTSLGAVGDVYAPHFYDPLLMAGGPYLGPWLANLAFDVMRSQSKKALFVGEFGVSTQMNALGDQLDAMDRVFASWAYWDYNPDLATNGTLEVDTFGVTEAHLARLRRPYPRALAGTPLRMGFENDAWVLEWTGAGESLLWIPWGVVTVETDAAWMFDPPFLRLQAGEGAHVLRITP